MGTTSIRNVFRNRIKISSKYGILVFSVRRSRIFYSPVSRLPLKKKTVSCYSECLLFLKIWEVFILSSIRIVKSWCSSILTTWKVFFLCFSRHWRTRSLSTLLLILLISNAVNCQSRGFYSISYNSPLIDSRAWLLFKKLKFQVSLSLFLSTITLRSNWVRC